MKRMKRMLCVVMLALMLPALVATAEEAKVEAEPRAIDVLPIVKPDELARTIDLTICLDVSGSMSGLINAAREKLWDIVSELSLAKPAPKLRVALLTFGNGGGGESHINLLTQFTTDLDTVFGKLMALETSGSQEYVGWVLNDALTKLEWTDSKDALKIIFVAGNESADQASQTHDFRKVCAKTIAQDIIVNSIYCGNPADNIAPGWREVAQLADGSFAAIDQDNGTIVIATPFDDKIAELGKKLNTTYVAYGADGQAGLGNQVMQDSNSAKMSASNLAVRNVFKAQRQYDNSMWDLVDARNSKDFDLAKIEKKDLPEEMQKMTLEEQNAHLDKIETERRDVQTQINDLASQRREFIQTERKEQAAKGDNSFDSAVLKAIRSQAEKKNFTFRENFTEGAGNE
ncbi:MAG: VWA domain-containing protein [Planctomycetes bacterium]|nr:VWA domain-containing protein [Planctomycetota bacterium]